MEDDVATGWQIDPEIRAAMRMERARSAFDTRDFAEAVIEVEELLDEDPDHAEALLLLGEAMLEAGDAEGAVQAFERRMLVGPVTGTVLTGLAIARFDVCDLHGAAEAAREAIRLSPDDAEAHYYLGLALERLPRRRSEALSHFAAAQQLDPAAFAFPLHVSEAQWRHALERALRLLPQPLADFWRPVPILFEAAPSLEELRAASPPITPTVTGMYRGDPPEEGDPWESRPEALRLFTDNLARSVDVDDLVEAIARTLDHEARDWLGLDPDEPV